MPRREKLSQRAARRQPQAGKTFFALLFHSVGSRLLVEPDVFEAPAVVDAVDHRREPFDIMVATGRGSRVVNDRPGAVLGQPTLDLPHQPLALVLVEFDRL